MILGFFFLFLILGMHVMHYLLFKGNQANEKNSCVRRYILDIGAYFAKLTFSSFLVIPACSSLCLRWLIFYNLTTSNINFLMLFYTSPSSMTMTLSQTF